MTTDMTTDEVRQKYINFFKERGHSEISTASLVPENDPTTLFTGSGMQPLIPYLLGATHPNGTKLVDSQRCFRAEDIDEIGDNRHTTSFEMLGNWSLGEYFKKEQLAWYFEFLTDVLMLDPQKLFVTVFAGDTDNNLPRDDESAEIWENLFLKKDIKANRVSLLTEKRGREAGMQNGRIFYYDSQKNWWSRCGTPAKMPVGEIGGPDSEVFFDFGTEHDTSYGEYCHPNCDCGRFVEIGNSVFIQYKKEDDGSFSLLSQKNVDFGGGLERMSAVAVGFADIFKIDKFAKVIATIEELSGTKYTDSTAVSCRIVADHVRGSVFMLMDGVLASNSEQGYILRRLLRRAVRHADKLGMPKNSLAQLAKIVIDEYHNYYTKLNTVSDQIQNEINNEEISFRETLDKGLKVLEKIIATKKTLDGDDAFMLFTSHGFPMELTEEIATERGIKIDSATFKKAFEEHKKLSRSASEQKFKGGLADHSQMSIKYHTATHLLHQALRDVLGDHVFQKGSNITANRLRFDFLHNQKMNDDEKQKVEDLVNKQIDSALEVTHEIVSREEAQKRGAMGLFEDNYGDDVKVYKIGAGDTRDNGLYSLELCGGPHVTNTRELGESGRFKIKKEEAVSAGVRRIKAVIE